ASPRSMPSLFVLFPQRTQRFNKDVTARLPTIGVSLVFAGRMAGMASRILIVEDDPDIAELVARYLDKAGFTTERAASGRDALTSISVRPPDLLVLDLMLPHVDGLEVCRTIRGNDATAGLPIIMLTARADESERIVGLELGADDYLAKPFSPNELVARVRALLRRAQRAAGPRPRTVAYGPLSIDPDRHVVSLHG